MSGDSLTFNVLENESCFDAWMRKSNEISEAKSQTPFSERLKIESPKETKFCRKTVQMAHEELKTIVERLYPDEEDTKLRKVTVKQLRKVVKAIFPSASLSIFGSSAVDLYLPCSDIDVVVHNCDSSKKSMYKIAHSLRQSGFASDTQVISKAKVPVIKCEVPSKEISRIDISFGHTSGLDAIPQIQEYVKAYPNLRPLVFFLKMYLLQRGLNEPFTGGLGSFALILMLVSFFQHNGGNHSCPATHSANDANNLGVLLLDFFKLYGKKFNYFTTAISTLGNGSYFRKPESVSSRYCDNPQSHVPFIVDPVDPSNNVTRSATQMDLIRSEFAESCRVLKRLFRKEHSQQYIRRKIYKSVLLIFDKAVLKSKSSLRKHIYFTRKAESVPPKAQKRKRDFNIEMKVDYREPRRKKRKHVDTLKFNPHKEKKHILKQQKKGLRKHHRQ
jgi:non-canonical poly(A) RNA polymerase PAPD5/7